MHENRFCELLLPTNKMVTMVTYQCYTSGQMNWSFCVGIDVDRATCKTRCISIFSTQVKEATSVGESMH